MKKIFCLQSVFLLVCFSVKAQFPLSAEMAGLSGQSLFGRSPLSRIFGNSCTLDSVPVFAASASFHRSFMISELNEYSAAAQIRLPSSSILSAGCAVKGFTLFRYQEIHATLAKRFGRSFCLSLGIGSSGFRQGEGNGGANYLFAGSGLQVRLSPSVEIASGYRIPIRNNQYGFKSRFQLGLKYRFSQVFALQAEAGLLGQSSGFLIALRYQPHPRIGLDLGAGGQPFRCSLGCSMEVTGIVIRLAIMYSSLPGMSPAIGVDTAPSY